MPYLAHFGLEEHPFTLTPDVDYFFPTQEHANIIASVEFALRRDTGEQLDQIATLERSDVDAINCLAKLIHQGRYLAVIGNGNCWSSRQEREQYTMQATGNNEID